MSIHRPPDDWFKPPGGAERMWIGLAMCWCLVMFVMMPYWHFKGKQNSTGESYAVSPAEFSKRAYAFAESNQVGRDEQSNYPIVEVAPGGDGYLLAGGWMWYPILKLKQGQTYRIHVSSFDFQHGLSLQPMNMNFQVLPGYDHVLTLTPTSSGEFSIICNEYCGINHHTMTGKIIVTE